MTPAAVTNIAQAIPVLSKGKSDIPAPQEEKRVTPQNIGSPNAKDNTPIPVDTISISQQSRQTVTDVKKEEMKKAEPNTVTISATSDKTTAKVQFVYDVNGELSTRYLDSANRLVYQVPSELMLRIKESAAKADSAVDTKA